MSGRSLDPLTTAIRDSEFLRTVRALRRDGGVGFALAGDPVRALREPEIRDLVAAGNTAEDWRRLRVADGFRPGRVRHSDFRGDVVLGRFEDVVRGPGGAALPAGVYRSTLSDCVVGHDALVRNVGLLAGYAVAGRALVSDCGRVHCEGPTAFGNGIAIPIGPQCGGRWLRPFAEITLDLATALTSQHPDPDLAGRYAGLLAEYLTLAQSTRGVIGAGASVTNVAAVHNAYVGPAAEIDGATRIETGTILSSPAEPVRVRDGACVSESILQWAVEVCGPAVVDRTVLMEHSAVERFGKVCQSVIGPNSGVGGAEITASLVGPFVGCHHQSLLIAARWPGGRGNLGYGAAVGCNHTSRAPDQEAVLGEGLFIGLGTKLQYPADFSRAPYSVLASGLTLPPQKLAFPFSLVRPAAEPMPGTPPGANVLIPGWVLAENLYAVQRSALKFRSRDQARRHVLAHDVFRPDVMALVGDALRRLERPAAECEFYTEREIPGLGRNVLFERHRAAAVRWYADHLDRVRLLQLLEAATRAAGCGAAPARVTAPEGRDAWHALNRLPGLLEAYGEAVERSKTRDEERGPHIIDDYAAAHAPTQDDPVVRQTWADVRRLQEQAAAVLAPGGRHPAAPRAALGRGS
ncbi:MAG: hypothetical protein JWO38_5534 [Gemmataceae bacterium]|nr:hypothetical protein [Gemmataceae bacterium]